MCRSSSIKINEALHRLFAEAATEERSDIVSIGLGCTAVTTVAGGIGQKEKFYGLLHTRADALLPTFTSLLNNTCGEVLAQVGPRVKTAMLGPSTPMAAQAFAHLPVHLLAGTMPMDKEMVLKAVRRGQGTPVIHKYSRKVYLELSRHDQAE